MIKYLAPFKMYVGGALLVLSFFVPFLGLWIAQLPLSVSAKTMIIGLLTVGGPEIMVLLAVALLGKETFNWLRNKLLSMLGQLAPRGSVSRFRYNIGLVLFVVSFLPGYVLSYDPSLVSATLRIAICASSDLLFLCSLFVLGGDFWDKLRALFLYNASANIPQVDSAESDI